MPMLKIIATEKFEKLLSESVSWHLGVCPRQVLGVRMGMFAGTLLDLELPQIDKRLLTIVETDGCFASGISAATGCWVGRRTLRVNDFGKVAATFVDTITGECIRLAPQSEIRSLAKVYAPDEESRWQTQLVGYQLIPDELLFSQQQVDLCTPISDIISKAGLRTNCQICGEEIMNQREVLQNGKVLCKACAGFSYYSVQGHSLK